MFNLFKKTQKKESVSFYKKQKKYPEVVEEIHSEFYSASEKILQEATQILKDLEKKDLDKGNRLANVGFNNTREAVTAISDKRLLENTKEIADLVMYYNLNYPNNKFITESQVKVICEKYGLVFGDTSMYKGFVPESKLSLIENFKVKEKDKVKIFLEITSDHNGGKELPISFITDKDLTEKGIKYFGEQQLLDFFYIKDGIGYNCNLCKSEISKLFDGFIFVKAKKSTNALKIVAPAKDMQIPEGKKIVGYRIQDIPDPVVLQPVKGGYLIVCAWGDEASDEIVVNQKLN